MISAKWLALQLWHSIYLIRQRIPLYANDDSRIAVKFSNAILNYILDLNGLPDRQAKIFTLHTRYFTNANSRKRVLDVLAGLKERKSFERALETSPLSLKDELGLSRFLTAIKMSNDACKNKDDIYLSRKSTDKNSCNRYDHIILLSPFWTSLPEHVEDGLSAGNSVLIVAHIAKNIENLEPKINAYKERGIQADILIAMPHYIGAYSEANIWSSESANLISENIVDRITAHPQTRSLFPKRIHEEIKLAVSDDLYNFLKVILSYYLALRDHADNSKIYISDGGAEYNSALHKLVQHHYLQKNHFKENHEEKKLFDGVTRNIRNLDRHKDYNKVLNQLNRQLSDISKTAFHSDKSDTESKVFILSGHPHQAYQNAISAAKNKIAEFASTQKIKFYAERGTRKNIRSLFESKEGQLIVNPRTDSFWLNYRPGLIQTLNFSTQDIKSPYYSVNVLATEMTDYLFQKVGFYLALPALYTALKIEFSNMSHQTVMLAMPERLPTVRCAVKAAQDNGIPTLDVQVLFISEMPRYVAPISDLHTVIDEATAQFYRDAYNIKDNTIIKIGTPSLDLDYAPSNADKKGSETKTLFFATQPIQPEDLRTSFIKLAGYLHDRPNVKLIVKPHPAHISSLEDQVISWFSTAKIDRAIIDRIDFLSSKVSLSDVLPGADVLITYYSNVGLLAPAYDLSLISLPCSEKLPKSNLISMGLSTPVGEWSKLADTLDSAFDPKASARNSRYIKENPHMAEPKALERLSEIVKDLLDDKAN